MKSPTSPTSQDVARLAGVSRSIVSGVLNGTMSTMRVSPETRERVLAAARELGYTPNPVARALRRQRSNVIGFIPRTDRATPYESPVPFLLSGHLAMAGLQHGLHIIEAIGDRAVSGTIEEQVGFLVGRHVDGVILDSPLSTSVEYVLSRGLPAVQMIRPTDDVNTPSVQVDAVPGIEEAMRHLLDLGHRDIGFIGTDGSHIVDRSRRDTYRAALRSAGIEPQDEWTILVPVYNLQYGREGTQRLLKAPRRPTAVVIAGDNLATGALQCLYEHHIRIPDDLSVISYDNTFASNLIPPLTSVHQPLAEAASHAVALLLSQLDTPLADGQHPEHVVLPSHLVVRSSVRSRIGRGQHHRSNELT